MESLLFDQSQQRSFSGGIFSLVQSHLVASGVGGFHVLSRAIVTLQVEVLLLWARLPALLKLERRGKGGRETQGQGGEHSFHYLFRAGCILLPACFK